MSTNAQTEAMRANLDALHLFLEGIQKHVEEARGNMQQNNCAAVAGAMLEIAPGLELLQELCWRIIALHRK